MNNYVLRALKAVGNVNNAVKEELADDDQSSYLMLITKMKWYNIWKSQYESRAARDILSLCNQLARYFDSDYLKEKHGQTWRLAQDHLVSGKAFLIFIKGISKIDAKLLDYIYMFFVLHIAKVVSNYREVSKKSFLNISSLVIVMNTRSKSHARCGHCPNTDMEHECSLLYFNRAVSMITFFKNQTSTVDVQILIELSKVCLYEALKTRDSYNDSIFCVSNVYLAILYYTTGHNQTVVNHCRQVTSRRMHSNCDAYILQAQLLPQIDSLDTAFGFLVVFKDTIKRNFVNMSHRHCFCSIFAHYFAIKCYLKTASLELKTHNKLEKDYHSQKIANVLFDLLLQSAGRHLRKFHQSLVEYGFVSTTVSVCRAFYLYNHGHYEKALKLCSKFNLKSGDNHCSILASGLVLQLLDSDIASIVGLDCLVSALRPTGLRFMHRWLNLDVLVLFLRAQCMLKLKWHTSISDDLFYVAGAVNALSYLVVQFIYKKLHRFRVALNGRVN